MTGRGISASSPDPTNHYNDKTGGLFPVGLFFLSELFTESRAEASSVLRVDFTFDRCSGCEGQLPALRCPRSFCVIPANRNRLNLEEAASRDSDTKTGMG